jgi:hypothetical protein
VIRPKGLGLGADKSVALQTENTSRPSRSDAANVETLTMKSGVHCQLVSGKKEGQYGTVNIFVLYLSIIIVKNGKAL